MTDIYDNDNDSDNDYSGPSKSQRKRDMHALQALGTQLLDLPNHKLEQLTIAPALVDAVKETRNVNARGGRRRLLQYIGKLMRHEDADAIRQQLDQWDNGSAAQAQAMHRIEALRKVLLRDHNALTQFFDEFPHAEPQSFRVLVRNAQREAQQNEQRLNQDKAPVRKHYKQLFQAIKDIINTNNTDNTDNRD